MMKKTILLAVAAVVFATAFFNSPEYSHAFKLPDSVQTTCYDDGGNVIDCTGAGQDGEHNISPKSYTIIGTSNDVGLGFSSCATDKVLNVTTGRQDNLLQPAFDNAGNQDVIRAQAYNSGEDLILARPVALSLGGGYDCDLQNIVPGGTTTINSLTITDGGLVVDGIAIEPTLVPIEPIPPDIPFGTRVFQSIPPHALLYFTGTIPAGERCVIFSVVSLSQNTDLDLFVIQGGTFYLSYSTADNYYSDFVSFYDYYGWLGYTINLPNPAVPEPGIIPLGSPPAWARMNSDVSGESIILCQGSTLGPSTTPILPGKYYIVVKNKGDLTNTSFIGLDRY